MISRISTQIVQLLLFLCSSSVTPFITLYHFCLLLLSSFLPQVALEFSYQAGSGGLTEAKTKPAAAEEEDDFDIDAI